MARSRALRTPPPIALGDGAARGAHARNLRTAHATAGLHRRHPGAKLRHPPSLRGDGAGWYGPPATILGAPICPLPQSPQRAAALPSSAAAAAPVSAAATAIAALAQGCEHGSPLHSRPLGDMHGQEEVHRGNRVRNGILPLRDADGARRDDRRPGNNRGFRRRRAVCRNHGGGPRNLR